MSMSRNRRFGDCLHIMVKQQEKSGECNIELLPRPRRRGANLAPLVLPRTAEIPSLSAGRRQSLQVNFAWTLAGNLIYAGTQWGILVLLARLGTPATVGQFSLGLAITAPIMLFASLQLRSVEATDAQGLFGFSDYASLRLLTTMAGIAVILAIGTVAYRGNIALVITAFGLSKGVESLSDVIYGLWQQQERMELIGKSLILRGSLALVLSWICFASFRTVWAAVFGIAAAWAVVFAVYDIPNAMQVAATTGESIVPSFSVTSMKELFRVSVPLGIVVMLASLNINVPRYVIYHVEGIRELGIFSAVGYILVSGNLVVNSLGQSATPRLAAYFSGGRLDEFRRLSNRLIYIGAAVGSLGVLASLFAGRWILTVLYGREYAGHVRLLTWMMGAAGFTYMASFAGYSLTAARKFRVQMPLFAFIMLLTLGLCAVMVRTNGATGAAQAVCAAGVVQLLVTIWLLRRGCSPRSTRGQFASPGEVGNDSREGDNR
jgi:O-antigen/teichoic acid export membrane protein